ncbi:hypothetical protein Tco_1211751 [Tanacetum coccineum]
MSSIIPTLAVLTLSIIKVLLHRPAKDCLHVLHCPQTSIVPQRNYRPDMKCQELERMHQLTALSQDHKIRLVLHSQTIHDIMNHIERISDHWMNKRTSSVCSFEARALNKMTWLAILRNFMALKVLVGLLSWFESVESKLSITKCAEGNKVEYTACLLQGRALTWWNTQVQTRGREAANGLS